MVIQMFISQKKSYLTCVKVGISKLLHNIYFDFNVQTETAN